MFPWVGSIVSTQNYKPSLNDITYIKYRFRVLYDEE